MENKRSYLQKPNKLKGEHMNDNFNNLLANKDLKIRDAMQQMDDNGEKILFIVDQNHRLLGSLTDGDIRRWILKSGSLNESINKIYNKKPRVVHENYELKDVKTLMLKEKIEWIPVINEHRGIKDILLWDNVFIGRRVKPQNKLKIPVVIMAGGKGERLDPFTKILPKALIPVEEKPIIEIIMSKFNQFGIKDFYIAINHKSRMIKAYFEEMNTQYRIQYLEEKEPLGSAGSLKFLENKLNGSFIITNCDIIIEGDYTEIVNFHKKHENDITLVSSCKHYVIPYGVCNVEKGGQLKEINEKPEYSLLVNTGMYVIRSDMLKIIPDAYYPMTDFIRDLKKQGRKVGVYPISEKSWIDIGQWEEYKKAIANLNLKIY